MTFEITGDALGTPIILEPRIQHYAWGERRFIPELLGLEPGDRPHAEAWFGAHPALPALARVAEQRIPLNQLVSTHAQALLGDEVTERFGGLPYLLKVLAAAEPLSIQVHPSRNQAVAGHRRENAAGLPVDAPERNYRDPNHKPELIVALCEFYALCGFRPPGEIAQALADAPEIAALLPPFEETAASVSVLVSAYYRVAEELLAPALGRWLERLTARSDLTPDTPEYWVLQAHHASSSKGHPDRGLFFIPILNLVRLSSGQGLYIPAGAPHSYLRGRGLEVMASSDNVLRGGLTPKHVDVEELCRVMRYESIRPRIVEAAEAPVLGEQAYATGAEEFELHTAWLGSELSDIERVASGPETLLALEIEDGATLRVETPTGVVELAAGQSCLVPHGTRYRVRCDAAGSLVRVLVPGLGRPVLFRGRDPARLAFGTSGLRGLVSDITDLEAYVNTRGFLDYLVKIGDAEPGAPVAIAGDLRPSTDSAERSILRAVAQAIEDSDFTVDHCGRIPTPALTYYAIGRRCPSLMVTGSHIPFDRNGIKFNKSTGEVLKSDEPGILDAVERVRRSEYARPRDQSPFDDQGMLEVNARRPLPAPSSAARDAYVARYLGYFPPNALVGQRIVVYEHSAVGREILSEVLRGLGAEVHPLGRTEEFTAIDTEAISEACLRTVQALADRAASEFGPVDAVVSTDGDSDRPMLLGVQPDGSLRFFSGDMLGILTADYLAADAVAVAVSVTDGVDLYFGPRGIEVKRTRIGSPWVIAAMAELAGERRVGWECNGGFLTGSVIEREGRRLLPLPTRDALLPILAVLCTARRRGRPVALLLDELPQRFTSGGLLDDVPSTMSRATVARYTPEDASIERVRFEDRVAYVTDASGLERRATGDLELRLEAIRSGLGRHFSPERGFAEIVRLGLLDGIRITFGNQDVAHIRPSGNAPQLRLYAVASTERRAGEIVRCATETGGILAELLEETRTVRFVEAVKANIALVRSLREGVAAAELLAIVSGSDAAQRFGQRGLELAKSAVGAHQALLFSDDLPAGSAFGLLRLWQHLSAHTGAGKGTLAAFVFGEGRRAAPLAEAEHGEKAALLSLEIERQGRESRQRPALELMLRYLAPVERYLRRCGFDGIVARWGGDPEIPTLDLSGADPRLGGADVVSFVSQGVARTREGGIFPDPIAVSRALLDILLEEFSAEVNAASADPERRPNLDGALRVGLGMAVHDEAVHDEAVHDEAVHDEAVHDEAVHDEASKQDETRDAKLAEREPLPRSETVAPTVVERVRQALRRFETRHGRKVRLATVDVGDVYRIPMGQHRDIYDVYMSLNERSARGQVARALAGLGERRDRDRNLIVGDTRVSLGISVNNSVLIDCCLYGEGEVVDSVLIGTRARDIQAHAAFDVLSTAVELRLAPRSGSYRVVDEGSVVAGPGERVTTLFLRSGPVLVRVHEDTDLAEGAATYEAPILGNPVSLSAAHQAVVEMDSEELEARRRQGAESVLDKIYPD
ncbi:MAG: mannose-6-phosphate isomerase, class I [Polyangiaceae bacterium]|nr:mannose-6-phosphate isomerase, class I [Polyangiaceae bacterium]